MKGESARRKLQGDGRSGKNHTRDSAAVLLRAGHSRMSLHGRMACNAGASVLPREHLPSRAKLSCRMDGVRPQDETGMVVSSHRIHRCCHIVSHRCRRVGRILNGPLCRRGTTNPVLPFTVVADVELLGLHRDDALDVPAPDVRRICASHLLRHGRGGLRLRPVQTKT